MIPVTRPFFPPLHEYVGLLEDVWQSRQLTNHGPMAQRLEREVGAYLGLRNLKLVTNGTLAIQLALRALDVTREVITTPFSYVATTSSILWEHCTPVFADIEDQSFCIDPEQVEAAITPRTQAILATHVFGNPCDVVALQDIANRHGLKIIYDGAHAFGTKVDGRSLLEFGDISTLSFHATKLFHTGEGGALVFSDASLDRKIGLLRSFGHIGDEHFSLGINAKTSELQAAMGLAVLRYLPAIEARRKAITNRYLDNLGGKNVRFPKPRLATEPNYSYFPVVFESEAALLRAIEALAQKGIGARRYFYPSLNTLPYLDGRECKVSERVASCVACLPIYHDLKDDEVDKICSIISDCQL